MLELTNVSKAYKGFALKDVSFRLEPGYIMGLIGPNGAGKSTTIRMIMGLVHRDQGEIKVFGLDNQAHGPEIRDRIGYVYDENCYYDVLNPLELERIIASFYTRWNSKTYRKFLREFELPEKKTLKTYSKGMKMKYALAVALSHEADLIIMDEPTSGLDPVFRRELLDILAEVIQDEGRSVLFSSHISSDLERIADYITFLFNGQTVFSMEKDLVHQEYALVKGACSLLAPQIRKEFVGLRESAVGFEGVIRRQSPVFNQVAAASVVEKASLDDIMLYTKKGGSH